MKHEPGHPPARALSASKLALARVLRSEASDPDHHARVTPDPRLLSVPVLVFAPVSEPEPTVDTDARALGDLVEAPLRARGGVLGRGLAVRFWNGVGWSGGKGAVSCTIGLCFHARGAEENRGNGGGRAHGRFGRVRGALDRRPCGPGEHDRGALRPLRVHLHIHLRGCTSIGVGIGVCVHGGVQVGRASEAACGAVECDELFARGVVGGGARANVVLGLGVGLSLGVAAGVGGVEDENGDAG